MRKPLLLLLGVAVLLAAGGLVALLLWPRADGPAAAEQPPDPAKPAPAKKPETPFAAEFAKLKAAMDKLLQERSKGYAEAKTEEEREALAEKAMETHVREGTPLAEKALALVTPHAQDPTAVEVLTWILSYHSGSPATSKAADLLLQHHLKDPWTQETASHFLYSPMPWTENLVRALAEADLPREKKAQALYQLAQCLKAKVEILGLLKDRDARRVRMMELWYGKEYLAELRSADAARLEAEAVRLFTEVAEKYGDEKYGPNWPRPRAGKLGDYARSAVYEIKNLSIGKEAPEIEGEDIDGEKFKLSDYRGKVILLDFWGHW